MGKSLVIKCSESRCRPLFMFQFILRANVCALLHGPRFSRLGTSRFIENGKTPRQLSFFYFFIKSVFSTPHFVYFHYLVQRDFKLLHHLSSFFLFYMTVHEALQSEWGLSMVRPSGPISLHRVADSIYSRQITYYNEAGPL